MARLLSEKEFREDVLGRSYTSYWRQKKAGDVPEHIIIGRKIYYTEEAISEWIEKKKVRPTSTKDNIH